MTKKWVVIVLVLAVLLGGGAVLGTGALMVLISVGMGPSAAVACSTDSTPPVSVAVGKVPAIAGYSPDQIRNAVTIDHVRRRLGLPPRATQIAFMTAMVEGPNLLNPHSGDRDSQGMFQQRPSTGWGTPAQITDPVLATRAFFGMAVHTHNPGLTDIPNWQTRPMGEVAQAVQRSAYPDRYAAREGDAAALMQRIGADTATTATSTSGQPTAGYAAAALNTSTQCTNPAVLSGAFGSWNTLKSNSLTNIRAGVAALAAKADMFGLQELADPTHRQAAAAAAPGYVMTSDDTPVPIMYRSSRYTLLSQGRQLAFNSGQHVEPGVDGTMVGPKWVVWAEFHDQTTNAKIGFVN